jgi:hydrogenase nickel incorporation protein HypA/HybF
VHELSLCGAIADIVSRRARERQVAAVHLRVGALRQVVPETLDFCWTMVTEGTDLDGATLEVDRIAAVLHCHTCHGTLPMADAISLACAGCGSFAVDVVAGDEFEVVALDLAVV